MARFLFVLGTDEPSRVTRCFQLAKVAVESGHCAHVFLMDDGVVFARKDAPRAEAKTGDALNQYMPSLIEHETPIHV